MDSSLPDFSSSPWIVSFNEIETETLINPFDGCVFETNLPMVQGKQCLECFGDWLLVFDEGTRECFLANVTSNSKISLPPLLHPTDSLGKCALSSQTPPDCTVMFACSFGASRPGDKEWTKYHIDFDNSHVNFSGTIFGSKGKMYLGTGWNKSPCVVINTTTSSGACVEKTGTIDPDTCPMHYPYLTFWVESSGDIFLVRFYLHAYRGIGVTNIDIHRMDTSRYAWRRVGSIGDATFFLGANCVAVPSADAGTQPNCVYLLLWCYDGIRLYSIRLDDRTISFILLLPASSSTNPSDWSDTWSNIFWIIPQSFRQEPTKSLSSITSTISRDTVSMEDRDQMVVSPWSGLPVEVLEILIPKVSFVDYLRIRAVCKEWNLIEKPIQHARTNPMLIHATSGGMCKLFDPVVRKQYIVKDGMLLLLHGKWQTLRFSKHGWLLVTKGKRRIYAANPFTREVCKLPNMDRHLFSGISFSSAPKYPDSIVFAISKYPWQHYVVDVMLWRAGDNRWIKKALPCDTPFSLTPSNPVFFDNEFYCLGVHGNLGVFNPNDITWRVLDKPEPIRADADDYGDRFCHLVEFKGDLIAIFKPYDANPIEMFKLDRSLMSWEKMLRLDDAVLFVDNWSATIKSSQEYGCCNRIYLPSFGYNNEVKDCKEGVFYDLEDRRYKPGFWQNQYSPCGLSQISVGICKT